MPERQRGQHFAKSLTRASALPLPRSDANPLEIDFDSVSYGPGIYKWRHYFDIYHRHLAKFRGTACTMLEIGVYSGGSLGLWRRYLGSESHIHGLDIQPACKRYETEGVSIHIGDQGSAAFWGEFTKTASKLDIVIDDGSHKCEDQMLSLESLLPIMNPGGVYICEDVMGVNNRFAAFANSLADALNASNAQRDADGLMIAEITPFQHRIASIHRYPFIIVIEMRSDSPEVWTAPKRGTTWEPHMS